jgi:hypothetical protein
METITHRIGSTFELQCQYTDANDQPISIANIAVKSQIRDSANKLIADCVVTKVDPASGKFTMRVNDTSKWPVAKLSQDIQYTLSDGRIIITTPFSIYAAASVTI